MTALLPLLLFVPSSGAQLVCRLLRECPKFIVPYYVHSIIPLFTDISKQSDADILAGAQLFLAPRTGNLRDDYRRMTEVYALSHFLFELPPGPLWEDMKFGVPFVLPTTNSAPWAEDRSGGIQLVGSFHGFCGAGGWVDVEKELRYFSQHYRRRRAPGAQSCRAVWPPSTAQRARSCAMLRQSAGDR